MKQYIKLACMGALVLGAWGSTDASAQSSTTLNAFARIIRPICVSAMEEINFGGIYANATGGTATITPNTSSIAVDPSLRSLTSLVGVNNAIQVGVDESADLDDNDGISQGEIRVCGEGGFFFHLSTNTSIPLTDGAGHNMSLSNVTFAPRFGGFWSAPNGQLSGTSNIFNASDGEEYLNVGARLNVNPNQAAGIYQGFFIIFSAYN